MDVELQATCSALGYQEGNSYVKEPYCLETAKDLIRFLRRDTDTCEIRRQLGHAKIVQNDLLPLIKGYHNDKALFETITKLLVNLTQPVISVYNKEIPEEKTLRNFCLEIESHLQDTKEAFVDDELFGVLTDKIKDILQLDWEHRREEDRLQLERLFILIRNVLMIPPDPDRELRTDDDATLHDQILWVAHTSGLEDLILYVASSDTERTLLCMHVMEIISLMFREHDVESLASAGVSRSTTEKEKDQRELEMAREKEKAQKKANVLKYSTRHSRFGGTFVMKDIKSITEQDVIYHKPLCEFKSFSYDDGKVPKKKSKNLAPIKGDDHTRRSTLSMRLSLKEFCVQFLLNAYNPLMRAVKDALTHKSTEDNDETYYLWAMRYFMEFCRLNCKRVDLVSETMSMSTFHYIYVQLCSYYESSQLGKREEAKLWGRRSHLALKSYQELLRTLDFMNRSSDQQLRESAKIMQSNVFYMMEYRDIFVTLLRKFKESKQSRAYLRDLVESTHLFLKMLEAFTKGNRHMVVEKKGKGRRKKKKTNATSSNVNAQPELTEEELVARWENEISTTLPAVLRGDEEIPSDISPFDAASEISEDEQKVEAMSRIQAYLRDDKPGEATALLRACRDLWPENSQFGNEGEGWEEELGSLKEIFMASLPRTQSQIQPTEEENEDEDDILNQELGEEGEVTRSEQTFDFQVFIKEFATPGVIRSYATLLSEFIENSDSVNHAVVRMLHRVCHDLGYVGMMFQASVFKTFCQLLHSPLAKLTRYKELSKFSCWVVRQFTTAAMVNKKIFVDLLFWKSRNEALAITGDYDFAPKSKVKAAWTENDEEEVRYLYEKYRDQEHAEMNALDLIMGELTSNHTRIQVLKKLKEFGLIESAKDLRQKKSKKHTWTEEQIEELRTSFEAVRNAGDPLGAIMERLSFEKSKNSVKKQILALGLVSDKKELYKRKNRKSGKGGKGSGSESDDDESNNSSDSGDEGERLFPDENRRGRHGRGSGGGNNSSDDEDDGDYHEGDEEDDDDDEDVRLFVRQSASGVGDYVARLVENGYKGPVEWIQGNLRQVAEDRQEGYSFATPLVPLTEENETAMEDEIFHIFLKSLGISSPVQGQEMFWRIPKEFSASDLNTIADSLSINESGLAPGADAIQPIISRLYPNLNKPQGTSSDNKQDKVEKKKQKELKKKKKKKKKDDANEKSKKKTHRGRASAAAASDSESNDDAMNDRTKTPPTVKYANRKEIDPDTSDSGLDPEIEANELAKMRKEKKDDGKKGKVSVKDRNAALEKLMKKKKEKKNRRDRGQMESDATSPPSVSIEEPMPSEDEPNTGLDKSTASTPKSQDKIKKKKGKRITIASDSESDLDLDLSLASPSHGQSQASDKGSDQDVGTSPANVKTKKRVLESDSDDDSPSKELTPEPADEVEVEMKGKKRMRIMSSEDESDNEQNVSRLDKKESSPPSKLASDKESQDDNNEASKGGDSQDLDVSLHLHFDASSDEDDTEKDKENLNTSASERQQDSDIIRSKTFDSFPATLYTQDVGSDEENDHVPLSTALKRKRAVIEDDDEDD